MTDSLWMQVTKTAYAVASTKGQERMKYRLIRELAESLLKDFPDSAHLYVLEKLNTIGIQQPDMWRQVLTELDKLEAKNGREVGEHISRRSGELSENTGDDCTRSD